MIMQKTADTCMTITTPKLFLVQIQLSQKNYTPQVQPERYMSCSEMLVLTTEPSGTSAVPSIKT